MRTGAIFRTVAVAALLVGAACGSESAAAVARIKISQKIRSRVGATQQGLLSGGAGSSLGCHEKCGKKCKASSDCKDDSCNYDSYYCKNNHQCHWNDGKKRCKGKISVSPTSAPTVYPTTAPTVPTMSPTPPTPVPSTAPTSSPTATTSSKYIAQMAHTWAKINDTGFLYSFNATTQTGYVTECVIKSLVVDQGQPSGYFRWGVMEAGELLHWSPKVSLYLYAADALDESSSENTNVIVMPPLNCNMTIESTDSDGNTFQRRLSWVSGVTNFFTSCTSVSDAAANTVQNAVAAVRQAFALNPMQRLVSQATGAAGSSLESFANAYISGVLPVVYSSMREQDRDIIMSRYGARYYRWTPTAIINAFQVGSSVSPITEGGWNLRVMVSEFQAMTGSIASFNVGIHTGAFDAGDLYRLVATNPEAGGVWADLFQRWGPPALVVDRTELVNFFEAMATEGLVEFTLDDFLLYMGLALVAV